MDKSIWPIDETLSVTTPRQSGPVSICSERVLHIPPEIQEGILAVRCSLQSYTGQNFLRRGVELNSLYGIQSAYSKLEFLTRIWLAPRRDIYLFIHLYCCSLYNLHDFHDDRHKTFSSYQHRNWLQQMQVFSIVNSRLFQHVRDTTRHTETPRERTVSWKWF